MTESEKDNIQTCSINLEQERTHFKVISRIRESLELEEILQTTIQEIRQVLAVDRVGIVRLNPGTGWDEGEFIAETVLPRFSSALAARVQDHCFGERYAADYQKGRIHAVDDIYTAGLSDCHIEILSQFQVRANLLAPLLEGKNLWGLLCIHQCSGPRQWQPDEIAFVSKLALHLGVAIQHAELLAQTRQQAIDLDQALQDLQSAHLQLAQAEKMASLGQLAAGVAHEINNPVNFIKGNLRHVESYTADLVDMVNLYQKHCPADIPEIQQAAQDLDTDFIVDDLPKLLKSMSVGAVRISDIVKALQTFSHLDEVGLKQVSLTDSIDNTLLMLNNRLQATPQRPEIRVKKSYEPLPQVECYPGQINQVLMNLLTNAVDALDEYWAKAPAETNAKSPLITISTQALTATNTVLIKIEDNGPGMLDRVKAKLYDPFFTTKPVGQGTGLGLATSYQIVTRQHYGRLQCHSQMKQGTEFSIELPITQSIVQTPTKHSRSHHSQQPLLTR
ncbi:MAG: GAF domain-containing protein [Phormidesmis sp.]